MLVWEYCKIVVTFCVVSCPLHSICIDLFTQITPRTLLGFHYRHSFLWPPRTRLAFNKSSHTPFLAHALYVWEREREREIIVSLSSLDRDGFQSLKLKKRWEWILNHFPLKWGAILWRGLGDSLSPFLWVCVCVWLLFYEWSLPSLDGVLRMVIALTWRGWLSELKIKKEIRMDSK